MNKPQGTQTKAAPTGAASVKTESPSQEAAKKPLVKLSDRLAERNVSIDQWMTLENLFPGASDHMKFMVISYCRARKLDPMKKPCHIVGMSVRVKQQDGSYRYEQREIVMPGIYEYRTTAMRTGDYMGHTEPEYGAPIELLGSGGQLLTVPESVRMVFYRWHERSESKVEFPVRVLFKEVANWKEITQTVDGKPQKTWALNEKWTDSPVQMATKCCEAAGLREAFPDELGGDHTIEEMQGRTIDIDLSGAEPTSAGNGRGKPHAAEPEAKDATKPTWTEVPLELIRKQIDLVGIPENELLAAFELGTLEEIPLKLVNSVLDYLEGLKREPPQ